jgi:predicted XRE-type DNA-binding protein
MTPDERKGLQESYKLSEHDKPIILWLYYQGFHQRRIAALFDVNQGRIAEVCHGRFKSKK